VNDFSDLREKIDEAKRRLPLPELMAKEGLGEHAKTSAHCPFPGHEDKHKSFSVFEGDDGFWHWKCFAGCGDGDEIMFLRKLKGLSMTEAMNCYLSMAGFPTGVPSKSREYPKCPEFPKSPQSPKCPLFPEYPVSPVSEGQGLNGRLEQVLKALAARNACAKANTAGSRRWQLARDVRAIERGIARELNIDELIPVFEEWYRLSEPFLDPAKTRDAYLAAFLKELRKVRVPTGEGDTLNKAVEAVSKLTDSELTVIPGLPTAPESWRRLLALHRELFSHSKRKNKTYFLSYRDAAKAHNSLSHQVAYDITLAFERLGFIKIVDKGRPGPNGGKAAEFRYLLPDGANGEVEVAA
jgi:hypothetical protein